MSAAQLRGETAIPAPGERDPPQQLGRAADETARARRDAAAARRAADRGPRRSAASTRRRSSRVSVSPRPNVFDVDAAEIDRDASPGLDRGRAAPWTCRPRTLTRVAPGAARARRRRSSRPARQRAGDDGAEAAHREHAIDRQPRRRRRPRGPARSAATRASASPQRVQPVAGPAPKPRTIGASASGDCRRRARARRAARAPASRRRRGRPWSARRCRAGICSSRQIAKCSRVCGITDFVGGNDQQHRVDAADAGQHVLHEPLVAGHVDEGDVEAADLGVREPEVDGDPARLLFLQAIGIGAGRAPGPARSSRDRCGRPCR